MSSLNLCHIPDTVLDAREPVLGKSKHRPCLHGTLFSNFVVVQSLSCVWLMTPWTAACQSSLSFTISWSLLRFMPTESVMLSNQLILLPSVFPSIRVFSNESALWIRWLKFWSFIFSSRPSNEYSGLISFRMDWFDPKDSQESSPAPQFESINSLVLSLLNGPALTSTRDSWKNHSFDCMYICQHSDVSAF